MESIFKVFQKTTSHCNISKLVEFEKPLLEKSAPVERIFFQLWGTYGLQKGVGFQYLLLKICQMLGLIKNHSCEIYDVIKAK